MSEIVQLNKALNKESKYYGLKTMGLAIGAITGMLVIVKYDFTIAIIASLIGYLFGSFISKFWHKGMIQRWAYWNLPSNIIFRNKYLPSSNYRRYL
ncbi:MAG: hypothetical protein SFT68_00420 [Rickettsiaceae bacterium]|nr:hypothetical protein [Rickettsiaceae bacterium]